MEPYRSKRFALRKSLVLVAMSALSLCALGFASQSAQGALRQGKVIRRRIGRFATPPKKPFTINSLTPLPSGPGLIVCEPVITHADADATALAIGCARWLHFTLSGQPEFGKTPLWASLDRARGELGYPDPRLSATNAIMLAKQTGATHVAVGKVSGNATHITLTYRLWDAATKQAVGSPQSLVGSPDQIVAGLPGLARRMATQLGVTTPQLPSRVEASTEELELIGQVAWTQSTQLTAAQEQKLIEMASWVPLAAFVYLRHPLTPDDLAKQTIMDTLAAYAGSNANVFAELGTWVPIRNYSNEIGEYVIWLRPYHAQIVRLARLYPHNYLIATAEACLHRQEHDSLAETRETERAVRCAPRNAAAWMNYGSAQFAQADDLRVSRLLSALTDKQNQFVAARYSLWLAAERRAVQLDTHAALAWQELCIANMFDWRSGDPKVADAALSKAALLSHDAPWVLRTGMNMYLPQWYNKPERARQLAEKLLRHTYTRVEELHSIAVQMQDSGLRDIRASLLNHVAAQMRAELKQSPSNANAHYLLAQVDIEQDRYYEALAEFRLAERLLPNLAALHYRLGVTLYSTANYPAAALELRTAVRLRPDADLAWMNLGLVQVDYLHKSNDEEQSLLQAIKVNPNTQSYWWLEKYYEDAGRVQDAIRICEQSEGHRPGMLTAQLATLYYKQGRLDAAIQTSLTALRSTSDARPILQILADAYTQKGEKEKAVEVWHALVQRAPRDPGLLLQLGKALLAAGHKDEARDVWDQITTISNGSEAAEARKLLEQNP